MITRDIETQIKDALSKNKIIHIPGPRQVGKTTLLKKMIDIFPKPTLWLNGDETDVRNMFNNPTSTMLKSIIGNNKCLIIDEAQRINDIGIVLKLIHDNITSVRIIVSGSSAFELANKINEPLTGRKIELFLFPLSFSEMAQHTSIIEEKRLLENRIIYGYYPEVINNSGNEKEVLQGLTDSYLYKDLLSIEYLKKPGVIERLLQALAFQIGNEVSYNELSRLLGIDNQTVEKYINYLEQSYIIFKLTSLSRNLRNEIRKGKKIYFYDNGIRNSVIKSFNPLSLRNDKGELWENFMVSERLKFLQRNKIWTNNYFWRTHAQSEIDYIEEMDNTFYAFEFKWSPKSKGRLPIPFNKTYTNTQFKLINSENYLDFIL
jgi:predicted AAA+ superfamily ATPase